MALAWLRYEGVEGAVVHFDAELGINQWYLYAIGDSEVAPEHGIGVLAAPSHTSQLFGPVTARSRGRVSFDVPTELFDRENQYMQLMSFRTGERHGPAVSPIVRVPAWRTRPSGLSVPTGPRIRRVSVSRARSRPFRYVEAQQSRNYSSAMFWQALIGLLPQIIPAVAPLVSNLLGGLFGGRGGGGGGTAGGGAAAGGNVLGDLINGLGALVQKPEGKALLNDILKAAGVTTVAANQPAVGGTAGAGGTTAPPRATGTSRFMVPSGAVSRAQFIDGGVLTGPMLAGLVSTALPSLMPMLQQFASPEMMNTLLSNTSPEKTIGALTDIVMDPNRRQFERLWQHTPQVGPSVLPLLLAQMSEPKPSTPFPSFRQIPSVTLAVEGLVSTPINGTSRVVYRAGRDMTLALSLATPRPIKEATLYWYVKAAATRKTLAYGSEKRTNLESGQLASLTIAATSLSKLTQNDDYLLCLALVWKDKKGARIGTLKHSMFAWVGEYVFDRVQAATDSTAPPPTIEGEVGEPTDAVADLLAAPEADPNEPIPLNDTQLHRDFWHKVWEGPFTDDIRTRRIEMKYYYTLDSPSGIARLETLQKKVKGEHDEPLLRLKTGLVLSAESLNRLAATLEPSTSLSAAHLDALRAPDFRARFAQGALTRLTLRGRAGERAAVWVFPEVKMHGVVLKRADAVADDGQVTSFTEEVVRFPLMALAHVVGARTAR